MSAATAPTVPEGLEGRPRSRVVAVAGGKGSPGCTFVAIGLSRCLAESGLETLLLDADAEAPGVAAWLDLPALQPAFARAAGQGALTPAAIRELASPAGERLGVVELGRTDGIDGRELAAQARGAHAAVVVDVGHGLGPFQRQLMAAADWVLWVVVPDRLGLDRADRALAERPPGGDAGLVANRCGPSRLRGGEGVLADRHALPLVVRIREDARTARAVLERGAAPHRRRPFSTPFRELARTVHPDCSVRVRAWP
ncbi:MAG: hypothetical protein ACREPA_03900 [Candidatus Dormibacteraceae bacterium]